VKKVENNDCTVPMQCTHCHKVAKYSPLRLGRVCGICKEGRWIPKQESRAMKDQTGKDIEREFAPNKRDPGDKYKVRVVEKEPTYDVTQDEETKRPIVKKREKK
jgi:hypothetical protein